MEPETEARRDKRNRKKKTGGGRDGFGVPGGEAAATRNEKKAVVNFVF
jgi:hypothetical protein